MRAAQASPRFARPLGRVVGRLPQFPVSAALAAALNLGVGGRLDPAALAALRGSLVRIAVRDAGLRISLYCDGRRFVPRASRALADVTISADLLDFVALALREEDPDTLFFARRLAIEGDTELGLIVKNALDALDFSALLPLGRRLFSPWQESEPSHARGRDTR